MTSKLARGVIHGKTTELTEDLGLAEGLEVQIRVEVVPSGKRWGEGILRSAGALTDDPHWGGIMGEIYQERKGFNRSEPRQKEPTTW